MTLDLQNKWNMKAKNSWILNLFISWINTYWFAGSSTLIDIWFLKPNLYALSKKTKSRIPPSIIHNFYQLKVRYKLDSMDLTIWKFLWPQMTPRSELLGLKTYCALKICSLLVKNMSISGSKNRFLQNFSEIPSIIMT